MKKRLTSARKICGDIYLILIAISFFLFFIQNTMLISVSRHPLFPFVIDELMLAMILFSLVCLSLDYLMLGKGGAPEKKRVLPCFFAKISIFALTTLYYSFNKGIEQNGLCLLLLFTITAELQDEKKVFSIICYEASALTAVLAVLSLMGIVENVRRVAFGFIYGDHLACFLMILVSYYCVLKNGFLTWSEEIIFLVISVAAYFIGGRTAAICLLIILFATFYRHFENVGAVPFQDKHSYGHIVPLVFSAIYFPVVIVSYIFKIIHVEKVKPVLALCMKYSCLICAGISVLFSLTYRKLEPIWAMLPIPSTLRDRFIYGQLAFDEIPIRLFGTSFSQRGAGGTDKAVSLYYFIDNSFLKLLFEYGFIAFVLIIFLYTAAQMRLYYNKRFYSLFLLSVFTADSLIEFELRYFTYTLFILLAFCKLTVQPDIKRCDSLKLEKLSSGKRWLVGLGIAAACAAFGLWSVTAYQITGWRGWTPDYGATLVVADKSSHSLTWTRYYMNSHDDAACVVDSDEAKDWLVSQGIDADRLWVRSSTGVDDMLTGAYSLIKEKGLPDRLTVCTADILQGRIARRAEALHIPVNSLAYKLHGMELLRTFAAEQWRTLWER